MTDAERTLRRQIEEAQREASGEDGNPSAGRWLVVGLVCGITALLIWKSLPADDPLSWQRIAEWHLTDMASNDGCITPGRAASTVTIDGGCPACPFGKFRW
jgi:hypothetical protein